MREQGYSTFIKRKIEAEKENCPIFTEDIARQLADEFELELPFAKRLANQNMKRLADEEKLTHFAKGIYYKPIITPFGKSDLNKENIFFAVLTDDDGDTIGYEGCPSLLNTIGLSTLMTAKKNVVTNKFRKVVPAEANLQITKPRCEITTDNAAYLQAMDVICGMQIYHIDAERPREIVNEYLNARNINPIKLIAYARKVGSENTLEAILNFYTEGMI